MNKFISEVTNEDCMEGMARYPDKYFDLAIVDPPYGINMDGGNIGGNNAGKTKDYTKKDWDNKIPDKEYFNELKRISKNQIIWGANHFVENIYQSNSSCWIVWDKDNTGNFADCELAYTSFKTAVRMFTFRWNGMLQQDMKNKEYRIHPTQKPVALYKWLLHNYANQGDKILDTHLGSGSSRIAAYEMGYDFTAFELDTEYYEAQEKRYKAHIAQLKLELI
jgi:site-specific DNA-methyltransferase (adenine-specific)